MVSGPDLSMTMMHKIKFGQCSLGGHTAKATTVIPNYTYHSTVIRKWTEEMVNEPQSKLEKVKEKRKTRRNMERIREKGR